jgi:glycine dehydrogenase subunit 1
MRYLPHTDEDVAEMLGTVGVKSLDDLFITVPEEYRRKRELDLPGPMTEWELTDHVGLLAGTMAVSPEYKVYVGAGSYEHYIPQSVLHLLGRSEFSTSYTPYQPEISQGTLQAIYEYQTLVARLLGMEVANASLYDGASALAEALLTAIRITGRGSVAISRLIHPLYRSVVRTYLKPAGVRLIELPYWENGTTDLSLLQETDDVAAVAVQSPNFFGCIEDLATAAATAHEKESLLVASFSEPLAYGLMKNPGSQGADIACGEGQSFGVSRSFGGPGLGMFATRMKFVRHMPGRLVGKAEDTDGKRGFVLTLSTREQHIRREKATSNICTNHSLCALSAAMYMASLGGTGIRQLAQLNYDKSEYLKKRLAAAGCKISFDSATFNEFVVQFPAGFETTYPRLLEKKIVAGLALARYYPELEGHYLLCVTEVRTRREMDALVEEIAS